MVLVVVVLVALACLAQGAVERRRSRSARAEAEAAWERRHAMALDLAAAVREAVPGSEAAVGEVLRAHRAALAASGLRERLRLEARLGTAVSRLRDVAERDARLRGSGPYVMLDLRLGEVEEDLAADLELLAR